MNPRNLHFGIVLSATLTAACLLAFGCSDDGSVNPPVAQAPDLPPMSSFMIDFSDFQESAESPALPDELVDFQPGMNWFQSFVRASFWNTIIAANLAIPAAAFGESFKHEPVMLGDSSWQWSYSVTVLDTVYTCRLNGKLLDDEVLWNMYVTQVGGYTDYLWYSGNHDVEVTEGTWTVNCHPDDAGPFIGIVWHRNPVDGTGDIKYTYIVPGHSWNGRYISHGSTTDTGYDRFYHIYDNIEENLAEIEWNYSTKAGRVRDQVWYHDADWHCWNESLEDIDCP